MKLTNTNCNKQCFLDFVNPALPSWSDEFRATCDYDFLKHKVVIFAEPFKKYIWELITATLEAYNLQL